MEYRLSHTSIFSFQGDVIPLRLLGGEAYGTEKITWSCSDEGIVQITRYDKSYHSGGEFTDGVLLTLLAVGEATVFAKRGRKEYVCSVKVREMKHAESSRELRYFVGDMHDHTWNKHALSDYIDRDPSLYPINNYMPQMKADGKMDFGAVTDHSNVLCARDFFRGYADAEDIGEGMVFLPGSESQVTIREKDRYGISHMHGGEVLVFNSDIAFNTDSWDKFFDGLKHSPCAFCGYPHPQIIGFSVPGIWDFRHRENNGQRFKDLFRFIEIGNGTNECSNLIHEYVYSAALDEGFHLAPTCSSDAHGSKGGWGYHRFPGKTVIMAPERTKEAFIDAILHNRMYSCSSGNVKLYYEVNGKSAPATLNNEGEYSFHVEISYFRMGETDTHIKKCKVITDKGIALVELQNPGDVFDFTVSAPDSHYFFLTLIDEKGRKTWSCPVWTGRAFEKKKKEKKLVPIPKDEMTVYDRVSDEKIPTLINDKPLEFWESEYGTADLMFDLGKETEISALSHFPLWMERPTVVEKDHEYKALKKLPIKYRISTSNDGENFNRVASGSFRIFGWEETVRFPKTKARYLRLEILSTAGKEWEREEFQDSNLAIAEITLWKDA